ncbi:MAG: aldo/keto reductase, partial [Clostridia bacterium]|nr:aldo/keto reductase [Clostridia bacterium]
DYLDLYLIHWPANSLNAADPDSVNLSTWKAMTELYKAGRIKAIGVSNFLPHHLAPLMECEVQPMVNQIEFHPGYTQPETVKYCHDNNILVEAWSPLGRGNIMEEPTLLNIAKKHNKSVAQICIKYSIQKNVIPLPKSVTPTRIKENIEVFDFELSCEDLAAIDSMTECGYSGLHPDTFNR